MISMHGEFGAANVETESVEGRKEALVRQLVRRFLLQAQTPAAEWSTKEASLFRLAQSILNR